MADPQATVILVEDALSLAMIYRQYLKDEDISLIHAADGKTAKEIISKQPADLILLDLGLPDIDGLQILKWLNKQKIATPVVVITADNTVDTVVDVMRHGALDFLEKPFDGKRLRTTVRNALKQSHLEHYIDSLKSTFSRSSYYGFVGSSLPMQAVYRIIDAAAPSKATVFISGESGTGKEICAEAIHKQSTRSAAPFIALNCAAIPRELMESEIFGHVKGAFTGAASERVGAAALANGGTLFLDEVAEMDFDLQTKLLRFIQTGCFNKVGSNKEQCVDIRIVCATNKDPLTEVREGRFREDLYYRLQVIPIHLPPLRERGDDILEIALHLLQKYAREENKKFTKFSNETMRLFSFYDWPGNVRQLQNVIRNIVVLHDAETVMAVHLPSPLHDLSNLPVSRATTKNAPTTNLSQPLMSIDQIRPLALVEREAIEQAITLCDGNIPKAAALLDVNPSTIYRKKNSWGKT